MRAIADFMISPARAGMHTHIDSMDLVRLPACRFSEPIATTTIKATATRAKRLMGMTSVMGDTEAVSWEFRNTAVNSACVGESISLPSLLIIPFHEVNGDALAVLIDFIGFAVL